MAEFLSSVERELEVGHRDPGDPECYAEHGHRMRVRVTVKGSYDAQTGRSANVRDLGMAMDDALNPLRGKPLSMIEPGRATPEGFGLWVMERLIPYFPKIVEVQVWRDAQVSYSISREPR